MQRQHATRRKPARMCWPIPHLWYDKHYRVRRALLRDLADIYHAEMLDAVKAGATIVELDDLIFIAPLEEWAFDAASGTGSSMTLTPIASGIAVAGHRHRSVWRPTRRCFPL